MSVAVQHRRGTAAEHASFAGKVAEFTYDSTLKTIRAHDGSTPGGFRLARFDELPVTSRRASGDANITITAADDVVGINEIFTSPHTLILPLANSTRPGARLFIIDEVGAVGPVNTLTITRQGADLVNGAVSFTITDSRQALILVSDGISKWSWEIQGISRGGTNATNAPQALANLGGEAKANKGVPGGYAALDNDGKVPLGQLPATIVGAMQYQGLWNAATNTPALANGVGTKGFFYKVSVGDPARTLDGVTGFNPGDMVLFDGTTWDRLDGNATEVLSVAGRVGDVVLTVADVAGALAAADNLNGLSDKKAARANIGLEVSRPVADANVTLDPNDRLIAFTTTPTGTRTLTLPLASSVNPGKQLIFADYFGGLSATNKFRITRTGSDTINGSTTLDLVTPFDSVVLISDGGSRWSYTPRPYSRTEVDALVSAAQGVAVAMAAAL